MAYNTCRYSPRNRRKNFFFTSFAKRWPFHFFLSHFFFLFLLRALAEEVSRMIFCCTADAFTVLSSFLVSSNYTHIFSLCFVPMSRLHLRAVTAVIGECSTSVSRRLFLYSNGDIVADFSQWQQADVWCTYTPMRLVSPVWFRFNGVSGVKVVAITRMPARIRRILKA